MKPFFVIFLTLISLVSGCGVLGSSSGAPSTAFNDPVPTGMTLGKQGNFTVLLKGKSVSGTAQVYTSTSSLIIRLQNFTSTADAALQVVAEFSDATNSAMTLRGYSGNQNYSFPALVGNQTVSSVAISSSTIAPPNNVYGRAVLQ